MCWIRSAVLLLISRLFCRALETVEEETLAILAISLMEVGRCTGVHRRCTRLQCQIVPQTPFPAHPFSRKLAGNLLPTRFGLHRQGLACSQTETLSFCNAPGLRATKCRLFAQISEMFVAARPNSLQVFRDFPLTDDRILKHCQLRQRP